MITHSWCNRGYGKYPMLFDEAQQCYVIDSSVPANRQIVTIRENCGVKQPKVGDDYE
jgi:hypothetical protein